jgi:hypothetical protein
MLLDIKISRTAMAAHPIQANEEVRLVELQSYRDPEF